MADTVFSFASDLEGWEAGGATHDDLTLSRTTAEGHSDGACLQARVVGKNTNPGQSWWEWTGTWEDLGVTPGHVVTEANGVGSFWTRCSEFTAGHNNNNVSGPLEIRDSSGDLIGTLSAGGAEISGTSDWTQVGSTAVSIPDHSSDTTIRLRLNVRARTANTAGAAVTLRQDTVRIVTTHAQSGISIERTVTSQVGSTDDTDAAIGAGFAATISSDLGLVDSGTVDQTVDFNVLGLVDEVSALITQESQNHERSVEEVLGLADEVASPAVGVRFVLDSLGLTDQVERTGEVGQLVVEDLGSSDSLEQTSVIVRTIVEEVGLQDNVAHLLEFAVFVTDDLGLEDSSAYLGDKARGLIDAVGLTDLALTSLNVDTPADLLGLSDQIGRTVASERTRTSGLGLADNVLGDLDVVVVDALGLVDEAVPEAVTIAAADDGLGLADGIESAAGVARSAAETLGMSDALAVEGEGLAAVVALLGLTDSVTRSGDNLQTNTDVAGITDLTLTAINVDTPSDGLELSDSSSHAVDSWREEEDEAGLTDSVQSAISVTIANALGIADEAVPEASANSILADDLVLTDFIEQAANVERGVTNQAGLIDTLSVEEEGHTSVTIADGLGLSDEALAVLDSGRTTQADLDLVDSVVSEGGAVRVASDSAGVADLVLIAVNMETPADLLSLSDLSERLQGGFRTISSALGSSDTAATQLGVEQATVGDVGLADSLSVVLQGADEATLADSLGLTDSTPKLSSTQRASAESLSAVDSVNVIVSLTLADSLGAVDDKVSQVIQSVALADNLGTLDAAVRSMGASRELVAIAGLDDQATKSLDYVRVALGSVGITDLAFEGLPSLRDLTAGIRPFVLRPFGTIAFFALRPPHNTKAPTRRPLGIVGPFMLRPLGVSGFFILRPPHNALAPTLRGPGFVDPFVLRVPHLEESILRWMVEESVIDREEVNV